MKFKRKFVIILVIVMALAAIIQVTRLNSYMKSMTNTTIVDTTTLVGETINAKVLSYATEEKYLVVTRDMDTDLVAVENNVTGTLDYMQKDYDVIGASEFLSVDTSKYLGIIISVYDVSELDDCYSTLINYVSNGGNLFFTHSLYNGNALQSLYSLIGVQSIGEDIETSGIKLLTNILLQGEGTEITDDTRLINNAAIVTLGNNVTVEATDINDVPLLWENAYGSGSVFYFNGNMFNEKTNRGLLAGVISSMSETDIYPIINAKVSYIDDFPSPVPDGTSDEIYNEYGVDIATFYKEIWWPDMLKNASDNNVKYTGVLIGTYGAETSDVSSDKLTIDSGDFDYFTRELLTSGGELGIHGYNHQPLVIYDLKDQTLGYTAWRDQATMAESINIVYKYIKNELSDYDLNVYVAPSNITSEDGIDAVKQGNPDAKIIATSYDGGADTDAYIADLEIEEDGTYYLPRITYEFEYTDESKWDILNSVSYLGYVAHFVHPDDILDSNRSNGKTWSALSEEYYEMFNDINTNYPWLTATTATEAANQLAAYVTTDVSYEKTDNYVKILCNNYTDSVTFILKTDKAIGRVENCEVTQIDDGAYLVKANAAISKINLQ